jgi:hypothetical protein
VTWVSIKSARAVLHIQVAGLDVSRARQTIHKDILFSDMYGESTGCCDSMPALALSRQSGTRGVLCQITSSKLSIEQTDYLVV